MERTNDFKYGVIALVAIVVMVLGLAFFIKDCTIKSQEIKLKMLDSEIILTREQNIDYKEAK